MKKTLIILGCVFAAIIIFVVAIFAIVSFSSEKLVCKSPEGNITIMYNDEEITGYTASNITYDLDGQKEVAKSIGIEEYIDDFSDWFEDNTSGECED